MRIEPLSATACAGITAPGCPAPAMRIDAPSAPPMRASLEIVDDVDRVIQKLIFYSGSLSLGDRLHEQYVCPVEILASRSRTGEMTHTNDDEVARRHDIHIL
jgi:hypothetical protein